MVGRAKEGGRAPPHLHQAGLILPSWWNVRHKSVQDPWNFGTDPDPRIHSSDEWIRMRFRILLFLSLNFKTSKFSAYYFEGTLKVHLHHFSKIKVRKKSQNSRNQCFSRYFCLMIEGFISGSGSDPGGPKTCGFYGSGSGSATLPESGHCHSVCTLWFCEWHAT